MTELAPDLVLSVEDLRTHFHTEGGVVRSVDGVSFTVRRGETLAVVGESGSGKSVTSLSIMGLIPSPPGEIVAGRILFQGKGGNVVELTAMDDRAMRAIRGNDISMVFQEPVTSLNPVFTIGDQIAEAIRLHRGKSRAEARSLAVEMLERVGIADPGKRVAEYPHQLSGGMRQRAMIAMALSCNPTVLIADEPTTALDVTIQAQILDLMRSLQRESAERMSIVFITHDLGVVADMADRVVVMYGGRIVEEGTAVDIFKNPRHPYTIGLLNSIPRSVRQGDDAIGDYRLEAIPGNVPNPMNLPPGCAFEPRCTHAIADCGSAVPVLAEIARGTIRAASGGPRCERGRRCASGRRAARRGAGARQVLPGAGRPAPPHRGPREGGGRRLVLARPGRGRGPRRRVGVRQDDGRAHDAPPHRTDPGRGALRGADITNLARPELREYRRRMQIIFQDPYASLDPRMRVQDTIGEALEIHGLAEGGAMLDRIAELLRRVGLEPEHMRRYPHEFSGGQRQRIGIARALAVDPEFVVADEPVSALDVSIQAQVMNLLRDLQDDLDLTMLFIAHDLSVVEYVSNRVIVMYLGRIMETAPAAEFYRNPRHPYTEALLSAAPVPDPTIRRNRIILEGDIPSPINPPSGCVFRTRCPYATADCAGVVPELRPVGPGHAKACIRDDIL